MGIVWNTSVIIFAGELWQTLNSEAEVWVFEYLDYGRADICNGFGIPAANFGDATILYNAFTLQA